MVSDEAEESEMDEDEEEEDEDESNICELLQILDGRSLKLP